VKIVHVSNFGQKPRGAFQHGAAPKISNGLIRNGHFVANFSDRDVARAGSWFGDHRKFGIGSANRVLREFCYNTRPDLLLLGHADVIRPKTLLAIRQDLPALKIVQWNVDAVYEPDNSDNIRRIRSKLEAVDATLVTTAGDTLASLAKLERGYLGFFPNPVDFSIESGRNHENKNLPYDLFYACGNHRPRNVCGEDWLPEHLFQHIESTVPGVRSHITGVRQFPSVTGAAYQQALESAAIGLNLSRRNDIFLYSSDRLAHMCGNGMAILMDRATGYNKLIGENEFAFFSTLDELTAQIRRLVADVDYRQALAKAGRDRYHALFNEQIVARYITDVAFGTLRESDYPWPTRFSPR
jgi:hypothetical protein